MRTSTLSFILAFVLGICFERLFLAKRAVQEAESGRKRVKKKAKTRVAAKPLPPGQELKMVLCVNAGLKMGKGKIAAQAAHGAVGLYKGYAANRALKPTFDAWDDSGQKKIALSCANEHTLMQIMQEAAAAGVPHFLVQDSGRTQIGEGSTTVLALGPGTDRQLAMTAHLKLI